jgi:hypothetical protein
MGPSKTRRWPAPSSKQWSPGCPSGSYLAMSVGNSPAVSRSVRNTCTRIATSERVVESHRQYNESGAVPYHLREVSDFAAFLDGLELVDPGVVPIPALVSQWRGTRRRRRLWGPRRQGVTTR